MQPRLQEEIKLFKNLNLEAKEEYVSKSYKMQYDAESKLYEFFVKEHDAKDVWDIVCEQIRDMSYDITAEENDPIVIPCARTITYKLGMVVANNIIKENPTKEKANKTIRTIRNKYKKSQQEKDKKFKNAEFINYVRGYSKYWRGKIDE